jgi:hypothetical protein
VSATTKRSFKLTDDGDLDISTGTFQFVSGLVAMKQAVRASILLFLGEWFLNTDEGTPWRQVIFVKNPNLAVVKTTLRARIMRVAGITSVDLDIDLNRAARTLSVSFKATCDFGVFDDAVKVQG